MVSIKVPNDVLVAGLRKDAPEPDGPTCVHSGCPRVAEVDDVCGFHHELMAPYK